MRKCTGRVPPGVHVVKDRAGSCWRVVVSGKTLTRFLIKKVAITAARRVARDTGAELVVHNLDGKISKKDSHGRDRKPPKGPRG